MGPEFKKIERVMLRQDKEGGAEKELTLEQIKEVGDLVKLTQAGLKPLSRWEGKNLKKAQELIEEPNLESAHVNRILEDGSSVKDLIFSKEKQLIESYAREFEGKPLKKDEEEIRKEGEYFGYPKCCVEYFIEHGYNENNLDSEIQSQLFHWACPDCKESKKLHEQYRQILEKTERAG